MGYILKYDNKEIGRVDMSGFMTVDKLIDFLDPTGEKFEKYEYAGLYTMDIIDDTIDIAEYATMHGVTPQAIKKKCQRGGFITARKIGANWFINKDEPYIDKRVKSGEYKDWRNKNTPAY